jgi:hypothetical protein
MASTVDKRILIQDEKELLLHEGVVDRKILLDTLPRIEEILDKQHVNRQIKRRIVNIAIEALQNLQLHSYPIEEEEYQHLQPIFILAQDEDNFFIDIGNLALNKEKPILEDKIKKVNSLNDEEVKFLYGVIMKQTVVKFSSKGGAGLGIIDMKKKSGTPLEYHFQSVDDRVTFFSLRIRVPWKKSK